MSDPHTLLNEELDQLRRDLKQKEMEMEQRGLLAAAYVYRVSVNGLDKAIERAGARRTAHLMSRGPQ